MRKLIDGLQNVWCSTKGSKARQAWVMAVLMTGTLLAGNTQAQSVILPTDNFASCTAGTFNSANTRTATGTAGIYVNTNWDPVCSGWTFTGAALRAAPSASPPAGALPFPGGGNAIWLNEAGARPKGQASRDFTGLARGETYRVSLETWTDDVDANTGLLAEIIDIDTNVVLSATQLNMVRGSGPQALVNEMCASNVAGLTTPLNLRVRLSESGTTTASPILTNVKFEALGQPCDYVVTYVPNGGTHVPSETVLSGQKASVPMPPTKPGEGFAGWYTTNALTTAYDFNTPVTSNLSLYAKWTANLYYVSGNVTGLASGRTLGLTLNTSLGSVSMSSDGRFQFPQGLVQGAAYSVQVSLQPVNQRCTVNAAGTGTIATPGADVTNVEVTCVGPYTVSFDTAGGSAIASQELGPDGQATRPAADPVRSGFVFDGWYSDAQTTQVYDFAALVNADVTVHAKWIPLYRVGGSLSGLLPGTSITLANNGTDTLVMNADGTFTFTNPLLSGTAYAVTIAQQPAAQICTVTNASGAAITADVNNVVVTCAPVTVPPAVTAMPVPSLQQWAVMLLSLVMAGLALVSLRRKH
ncbi:IPTL-CTERM sorting domain-containing protein [Diaphorobacter sp. HDW4A]|uniref:IPTL-CTERM sorting domain-containing protein n=1 Tax=Diaphorobacter sp. HDW4A TaxID=2714924 RepID=UPI00140B16B1|nr:IPTL-CTERM sorting domain-containing protein [Diaphorobacter sp. HDW4A]QIL78553.1 IPTL-CTERM sorting domain-containing protein [Diaphorobacter sp. HDW4A]